MPRRPSKTPSKQVLWARKKRDWLREQLGGKCVECGTTENLEFDHKDPRTKIWGDTSAVGFVRSITLYVRDYKAGYLQLLCRHDNAVKNDRLPPEPTYSEEDPF